MPIEIPLKLKYLTAKPKGFSSKKNISGKAQRAVEGEAHRRVNYGPFWQLTSNPVPINWPTAKDWAAGAK